MAVLNRHNCVQYMKNAHFAKDEVKSLCEALHLNKQETHIMDLLNIRQVLEEAFLINSTSCVRQLTQMNNITLLR